MGGVNLIIKTIFIALTYCCTANCEKCVTRYHKFLNQSMSKSVLDDTISFLKKIDFRGIIVLGSGEPLSYSYLSEFITGVFSLNDDIGICLLTNGKLFNRNLPRKWFNGRITFGITLDGFYNDDLLELQKGIDIDEVKKHISEVVETFGPQYMYLNYTLNKRNIDSVFEFIKFAEKSGIRELYVTSLKAFNGVSSIIEENVIPDDELLEIVRDMEILIDKTHINKYSLPYIEKTKALCWKRNEANPIIDIDGSMTFCSGREEKIIGNIKDDDIISRWDNQFEQLEESNNAYDDWCQYCISREKDGVYYPSFEIYPALKR